MKILIIQTARLGDVYLMWPAIRGLKRTQPDAEIHLLVRETFAGALEGLPEVSQVHLIPSRQWLNGLSESFNEVLDPEGFLGSKIYQECSEHLQKLRDLQFDRIVNMGYSPLSSWITKAVSGPTAEVVGYSRTSDGYLAIPDSMSAYFYAQVGFDRPNRFHLAEIFATLCQVDLMEDDWRKPKLPAVPVQLPQEFIALHVGGSEAHKTISVSKWISILSQLRKLRPVKIALIGGNSEKGVAAQLESAAPEGEIVNLVGELSLTESMAVIAQARLLIGPDSSPIHMASLTQTPVINLSVGQVKFWETGPRAPGSIVISAESDSDLASDTIADSILRILHNMRLNLDTIQVVPGTPSYAMATNPEKDFDWNLCEAIYMGKDFPAPVNSLFLEGIKRLVEVNQLLIEQTEAIKTSEDLKKRSGVMERCEEVVETVAKLVPSLVPLVRWYMTEKVRIGPGGMAEIVAKNLEIQKLLQGVLDIYSPVGGSEQRAEKEL